MFSATEQGHEFKHLHSTLSLPGIQKQEKFYICKASLGLSPACDQKQKGEMTVLCLELQFNLTDEHNGRGCF